MHLRALGGIEVYCPRLRIRRMTRKGAAWFVEALFPGYLFARFDRALSQKTVTYAKGVSGIVRFGLELAVVPDAIIGELRNLAADDAVCVVSPSDIKQGDSVVIARGAFQGLQTLVTNAAPASERVRVLLEILGECREVVVSRSDLIKEAAHLLTFQRAGG